MAVGAKLSSQISAAFSFKYVSLVTLLKFKMHIYWIRIMAVCAKLFSQICAVFPFKYASIITPLKFKVYNHCI
jgi:hypothetical protein